MPTWITQRAAAEILGVGQPTVQKMVRAGKLYPRPKVDNEPTLELTKVEALRDERAAAVRGLAERRAALDARSWTPPDDEHSWLSVPEVAALLGITRQAVNVRCRKEKLPSTMKGNRRWIRRDQVAMVVKAHAVRDGVEPPAWVWD